VQTYGLINRGNVTRQCDYQSTFIFVDLVDHSLQWLNVFLQLFPLLKICLLFTAP